MRPIEYKCDVYQALSWRRDIRPTVGYVNVLNIGGTDFIPSIDPLWHPIAKEESLNVVGVMDKVYWDGGASDPINISFLVDAATQVGISNILYRAIGNTLISIEFHVFSADAEISPPAYYPSFWTHQSSINGIIQLNEIALGMNIEIDSSPSVYSPSLFSCQLSILPAPSFMQLLFAANSLTSRTAIPWGVTN